MTWRVASTGSVWRVSRELLAVFTPLDPRVKPKDDDGLGGVVVETTWMWAPLGAAPSAPSVVPQESHWAESHTTKRGSIRYDLARRLNWLRLARFTGTACGIYAAGSSGRAQG